MDLDRDGEGYLSFDQFSKGMATLEKDQAKLKDIFKAMDTDKSGYVGYCNFLAAVIPSTMYLREDYLQSAFNMFDLDDNGTIDLVEISLILQGFNNEKV